MNNGLKKSGTQNLRCGTDILVGAWHQLLVVMIFSVRRAHEQRSKRGNEVESIHRRADILVGAWHELLVAAVFSSVW